MSKESLSIRPASKSWLKRFNLSFSNLRSPWSRLESIERRLAVMEAFSHGGRTTYMGDGLVLVKAIVNGVQIIFLVEAADRLIAPWFVATGLYETDLTEHFGRTLRKDDHCLDIGANFGYFTLLFGRFCPQGTSIGVEADETLFKIARDNIHINHLGGNTSIYHAAICETERAVTMFRRVGRSGNTSILKPAEDYLEYLGEAPSVEFSVPGVSIDQFFQYFGGKLDIIKIDIEGAEPLAFAGAQSVIAANPDLQIVMEWSPGQIQAAGFDVTEFLNTLSAMGLCFHRLDASATKLSSSDLLNIPYTAGILIAKKPRLVS
jgi:FkbM family methyltransferase